MHGIAPPHFKERLLFLRPVVVGFGARGGTYATRATWFGAQPEGRQAASGGPSSRGRFSRRNAVCCCVVACLPHSCCAPPPLSQQQQQQQQHSVYRAAPGGGRRTGNLAGNTTACGASSKPPNALAVSLVAVNRRQEPPRGTLIPRAADEAEICHLTEVEAGSRANLCQ